MEVVFRTRQLQRNYEQSARAAREWGRVVGRKYVTRIEELYAVENFQAAYGIRSLRLHPLKGSRVGELSIYLTGRWRLIIEKGETEEQVVIKDVSDHYGD